MHKPARVLYVDDNDSDRERIRDSLRRAAGQFQITEVSSPSEFRARLKGEVDLVLSDWSVLGFDGLEVIDMVRAARPDVPVVVITGTGSEELAVEAFKRGAADYVIKSPGHIRRLPGTIEAVLVSKEAERRRSEAIETLRQGEELFRCGFELSAIGMAIVDLEGSFIHVNRAICSMLGYAPEETLSLSFSDVTHPDDLARSLAQFDEFVRGKRDHYTIDNRWCHKDGHVVWGTLTVAMVPDASGNSLCAVAQLQTTAQGKEADADEHASGAWFRSLIELSESVYAVVDAVGTIRYESPSLERWLGWKPKELIGRSCFEHIHPEDEDGARQALAEVQHNPRAVRSTELRYRHKDRSWRWLRVIASNHLDKPSVRGIALTYQDITELKATERRLRDREGILNETGTIARIGGWMHDLTTGKATWTRALYDIIELDPLAAPPGVDEHLDYYAAESREVLKTACREAIEKGKPFDLELQCKTAKGRRLWCRVIGRPVFQAGKCVALQGTFQEITDVKRNERARMEAEESVRHQVRFLGELIDSIPNPVFYKGVDERYLGCNRAFAELLGRSKDEIVGKTARELAPEARVRMYEAMDQTLILQGRTRVHEELLEKTDGTRREVVFHKAPFSGPDGSVGGLIGVIVDITERKEAERELRAREDLLNRTGDMAKVGGWEFDLDDDTVVWTRTTRMIHEVREDDTPTLKESLQFYPEDARETFAKAVTDAREQGIPYDLELPFCTAKGKDLWVRIIGEPVFLGGRCVRISGTFQDITERKKAERALRESEEKYRLLIDDAEVLVSVYDEDGVCLFMNNHLAGYFGGQPEEFVGKSLPELHPEEGKELTARVRSIIETEVSQEFTDEVSFPKGPRWLLSRVQPLRTADGTEVAAQIISQDITARERAERALEESRRQLATLMSNLPGMAYRCKNDPQWTMEFVSDGARLLTGYQPDELLGNARVAYGELIHPDDRQTVLEVVRDATESGQPFQLNYRICAAGGEEKWVWEQGREVRADKGGVGVLEGFIADVTERRRAELALHTSEARFRKTQAAARAGSWDWEPQSGAMWWSDETFRLHGAEPDAFEPSFERHLAHVPAASRARYRQTVEEALQAVGPFEYEVDICQPDGTLRNCLARGDVRASEDGRPVRMSGTFLDITERKQAEVALARHECELRTVYDGTPILMVLLDQEQRVRRANRATVKASGRKTHDEVVGLLAGEALRCIHEQGAAGKCGTCAACGTCGIRKMVLDTLQTGRSHHRQEHRLVVERDGTQVEICMLGSSVKLSLDDCPHVLLSIEDITEQKKAESQLRLREAELAHMNRVHTVGEMAGTLAHELNQPLYAINNYVRGIQRRLNKQSGAVGLEPVVEALDYVSKEVNRAAGIVSHLREFVRGREPRRSTVDVCQLLQQAIELLQPVARERGVTLDANIADHMPGIQADPIQVEQVIVNLVTNAVDAVAGLHQERRRVTLVVRLAEWGLVEFSVRDSGRGISEKLRGSLFEAFVTTKENGLGVGLAISRSIVDSHGGKIWVVHNEPHGTAFHFTLPVDATSKESWHDH